MRLRASGTQTGKDYDLRTVIGQSDGSGGIAEGALLNEFAEAVCADDEARTAAARRAIATRLGPAALADAAGVVAGFHGFPRIADATGIPLEAQKAEMSAGLRAELGLDAFDTGRV